MCGSQVRGLGPPRESRFAPQSTSSREGEEAAPRIPTTNKSKNLGVSSSNVTYIPEERGTENVPRSGAAGFTLSVNKNAL